MLSTIDDSYMNPGSPRILECKSWALSFSTVNPIDRVVNQMEQTFPLKRFSGKKEYLQRYSSFLGFPGMILPASRPSEGLGLGVLPPQRESLGTGWE